MLDYCCRYHANDCKQASTSWPKQQPYSSDTLLATDMAATLLGCVHPIFPRVVYPASARYWVIWVVFPEPVSPITIRIWLSWTACKDTMVKFFNTTKLKSRSEWISIRDVPSQSQRLEPIKHFFNWSVLAILSLILFFMSAVMQVLYSRWQYAPSSGLANTIKRKRSSSNVHVWRQRTNKVSPSESQTHTHSSFRV